MVLMSALLIMSFSTKDVMISKLLVSLALITGVYASHSLSTKTKTNNEAD